MGEFDQENERLRTRLNELTRANYSLQQENQAMLARASAAPDTPVLVRGDEEDLYPGEIREMILDAISEKLRTARRNPGDMMSTAIFCRKSGYRHLTEKRKTVIKNLFKGYRTMTDPIRQELMNLGFTIRDKGKALQAYLLRGQPL